MENKTTFDPGAYLPGNGNDKINNGSSNGKNNASKNDSSGNASRPAGDTLERVSQVAEAIAARGTDITRGYQNWMRLAMALADGLGEAGRSLFHSLSAMNPQYTAAECDRQYDSCLKSHRGGITIATFFQMARDIAGIDLGEMARENVRNNEKCLKCLTVSPSYKKEEKRNDKYNSLIYNNLYNYSNNLYSPGDTETVRHLRHFDYNTPTGYTFSDKLQAEDLPPLLARITELHADVVGRDKMTIGALNIISGIIGAAAGNADSPSGIYGLYGNRKVYAPLYNIIFAAAGSSKGDLNFCRQLAKPLKDEMRRHFESRRAEYERELAEYEQKRKQRNRTEAAVPPREPLFSTPFVPGNSTSSAVYRAIDANGGWGLIFETEADTVSAMIASDYGNYSDLMRKAFHHEAISMNRVSEKLHIDIDQPRLSVLLTCTPGQLSPLFPNWENGLGSRFLFYQFPEEEPRFSNVFESGATTLDDEYLSLGKELLRLYHALTGRAGKPVQFVMSQAQQQFLAQFGDMLQEQYAMHGADYKAFVFRLALSAFRYAMVLATLRRLGETPESCPLFQPDENALVCDNRDFLTAMTIVETLANHTARVYTRLAKENDNPFADRGISLTPQEIKIFNALPDSEFKAAEFLKAAKEMSFSRASAYRLINQFCNEYGIIVPTRYAHYRKAQPTNETHN